MSWELDRIGVAPVEVLPLSNSRHCYPTVLLAEHSPLGLAEVVQEILPLARVRLIVSMCDISTILVIGLITIVWLR